MSIELRAYHEEDDAFLYTLYASTRAEELDAWGWGEQERKRFLDQQFAAQRQFFGVQYRGASHQIITDAGRPIGRIMVSRTDREIRLVDISLLPERRNEGIGTRLLLSLLDEAAAAGKPVRLSVLTSNPARSLYQRLGFRVTSDDGMYTQMEAEEPPD